MRELVIDALDDSELDTQRAVASRIIARIDDPATAQKRVPTAVAK